MEECRERDALSRQQQLQDWEREGEGNRGTRGSGDGRRGTGSQGWGQGEEHYPLPLYPPGQLPALLPVREDDSEPHSIPRAHHLCPAQSHSPAPQSPVLRVQGTEAATLQGPATEQMPPVTQMEATLAAQCHRPPWSYFQTFQQFVRV